MRSLDQISLLESSAIFLFGLLSLRYSEVKQSAQTSWMISDRQLWSIVIGDETSPLRGFGTPLKETVTQTCHEFFLKNFFGRCVSHLEFVASYIIKNGLLTVPSEPIQNQIDQFEAAVTLTIFICCNAVALSLNGEDLGPKQTEMELN